MATNNNTAGQARSIPPAKGLLSGLVVGAEHMLLIGCGGLLLVLVACGVVTWYTLTEWTTPTDPAANVVTVRPGETEHWAGDSCPVGRVKHFTQRGMVCR